MYYVPQLGQIPSSTSGDSKSDTTVESSHSGIQNYPNLFFNILFVNWLVNSGMTYESSVLFNLLVKMELFMLQSQVHIGELFGQIYYVYLNI